MSIDDHHHHHHCCISHQFHSAATGAPDKIAVIQISAANLSGDALTFSSYPPIYDEDRHFTYADLLSAVDSFSRRIRRVLDGGGRDDPDLISPKDSNHGVNDVQQPQEETNSNPHMVGVHVAPSVEYIVAVLSILRCGEAFLPIDPLWPEERIKSVIASSETRLIIGCPSVYSANGISRLNALSWMIDGSGCSVLWLSLRAGQGNESIQSELRWPCERKSPRKFCYLMYTSGSTGKPKGVCGTETGLLNRFWWMQTQFPINDKDVAVFKTSISFVDHLQEFLSAILTGTTLVVPPVDLIKAKPLYIVDVMKAYGISRLTSVPTLMRAIIPVNTSKLMAVETSKWMVVQKFLKLLVLSGEILSISLWEVLHSLLPETTILNIYGSTEVSGDCTYFDCKNLPKILETESLDSVPIGVPISNCEIDLVGETSMPTEGEISVGGACLFVGYFEEPFLRRPLEDNVVSLLHFKTGDFAKRITSGDLVFLGRKDRTIKVNGQRMALEEVENAIREHPEISDVAVTSETAYGELPCLQAFIVMKSFDSFQKGQMSYTDQQHIDELSASIRNWLARKLPLAMIPTHYFCTDLLPVSTSGKIDYAFLTSLTYTAKQHRVDYGKNFPFGSHLQIIKEVFCHALLIEEISDEDDFFLLGGNSISAAHAAHKLGVDMRFLYAFPTPLKLLHGLLDQKPDDNFSSQSSVSGVHDNSLWISATSKMNSRSIQLIKGFLRANNGKRPLDHLNMPNAKKIMSRPENDEDSPFSAGSLIVSSSLPLASSGKVSVCGHADLWISNLSLPLAFSLSRCNQIVKRDETEIHNIQQACSLIKIPRYAEGCMQDLWQVSLRSCVDASPLVVYKDGVVNIFIGSHAHIFLCIDALSGSVRWKVKLEGRIECSAAITGDFSHVVVGCYKGKIYFLDYMTGKISWAFQTYGEVKMQPTLDKGRNLLWCGSHDHCLYGLDYVKFCCSYKITFSGSLYGSPSIDLAHNMIYVATTSGYVSGLSLKAMSSEIVWSYELGAPIFGSLAVNNHSGNVVAVICCLVDGRVLALDSRGHTIWKVNIGGPIFAGACISSALPSQALVCSRSGSVYSLDMEGGKILWEHEVGDPITASAYVDEHSLFETESSSDPCDRLACVCSASGRIHVLRINSNAKQERANHQGVPQSRMVREFAAIDLPGDIFSSPVMIGGRIFVGCRDDYVRCIKIVT